MSIAATAAGALALRGSRKRTPDLALVGILLGLTASMPHLELLWP